MRDKAFEYFNDAEMGRCARTPRGIVANVGPQLREADRTRIESALECELPDDYWGWLLQLNGGFPGWGEEETAYFSSTVDGEVQSDSLDCFLSVDHPHAAFDLLKDNRKIRSKIPPDTIAIGMPNTGSESRRLLLGVRGARRGQVFDWLQPVSRGKKGVRRQDLLAATFAKFWKGLKAEMEED